MLTVTSFLELLGWPCQDISGTKGNVILKSCITFGVICQSKMSEQVSNSGHNGFIGFSH